MSWVSIRTGVKTRLDTISGLAGHSRASLGKADGAVATIVPSDPLILPSGHRGKVEVRFSVRVTVSKGSLEDSQTALDAYIWPSGTNSIEAAIYGDKTLSGAVDDVQFMEVVNYEQVAESNAVRAEIQFRAIVTA